MTVLVGRIAFASQMKAKERARMGSKCRALDVAVFDAAAQYYVVGGCSGGEGASTPQDLRVPVL